MIPKVIHYCWFGGNPLPELAQKCIASWKKYCPDYEIKEWNESNFDLNCCDYVREAYEAKKWAFVSDVARLYAILLVQQNITICPLIIFLTTKLTFMLFSLKKSNCPLLILTVLSYFRLHEMLLSALILMYCGSSPAQQHHTGSHRRYPH